LDGAQIGMRVAPAQLDMSAVLMTLFAVSIAGALVMAVYGLRVLVGRWEQPRRLRHKAQLSAPQPTPVQPVPVQVTPLVPPPVWVSPVAAVPVPLVTPAAFATPPPITLPAAADFEAPPGSLERFVPPLPGSYVPPAASGPSFVPVPTWSPSARAPSPSPRAPSPRGILPEAPRLARGSIPPDFAAEELEQLELEANLDPDTDPAIPAGIQPQVTRGARFSVVRSSRR
jgi:hypothetical protein